MEKSWGQQLIFSLSVLFCASFGGKWLGHFALLLFIWGPTPSSPTCPPPKKNQAPPRQLGWTGSWIASGSVTSFPISQVTPNKWFHHQSWCEPIPVLRMGEWLGAAECTPGGCTQIRRVWPMCFLRGSTDFARQRRSRIVEPHGHRLGNKPGRPNPGLGGQASRCISRVATCWLRAKNDLCLYFFSLMLLFLLLMCVFFHVCVCP